MTPEHQARIKRAKDELVRAMSRLPFDIQTADATRVDVFKQLHWQAVKTLRKGVAEPTRYEELTRRILALGNASIEQIVEGVYEKKEGQP